jgi:hypothetical protein
MVTRWDEDANPELAWFECSIDQLAMLREQALDELGESTATVNGLIGWLVAGHAEAASKNTRTTYRRILREVGPPSSPKGRGRRLRSVGQRGAVRLELVGASAAVTGAVLAAPLSPLLAAVAGAVAPIILDTREADAGAQTATQRLSEYAEAA